MKRMAFLLFTFLSLQVVAEENLMTTNVEKTVTAHIGSIACGTSLGFLKTPKQILHIPSDIKPREMYLVPWQGDLGCYGGTGSYQGHIALVMLLKNQRAIVIESDILQREALREINREFLTGHIDLSNNQLRIKSATAKIPAHIPADWFHYYIDMSLTADEHRFALNKKQSVGNE